MFGKVFSAMYDGTLATRGPWQALVTFQQFIVLADRTGIVDMTADAICRRTTIPIEIINVGIIALEQPDSESRSPDLDGRRIARLSTDRPWGWKVVNFEKYRKIRSEDERREYMANLMRERRAAAKATGSQSKHVLAKLAHADADADADKYIRAPRSPNGVKILTDLGVEQQIATDWLAVRKAKRAPLTKTVLAELQREAQKAGLSVADAVKICASRNWQGFNASWLKPEDLPEPPKRQWVV